MFGSNHFSFQTKFEPTYSSLILTANFKKQTRKLENLIQTHVWFEYFSFWDKPKQIHSS